MWANIAGRRVEKFVIIENKSADNYNLIKYLISGLCLHEIVQLFDEEKRAENSIIFVNF